MVFYNDEHKDNFHAMLGRWPQGEYDRQYRVACYIMAVPDIYSKATKQRWSLPFDAWCEQEEFSHGSRLLIDLGFYLFNGGQHAFNLNDRLSLRKTGLSPVFQQACQIREGKE